jgi:protein-disulfide isomerase
MYMRNPKPRGRAVQSTAPVARLRTFYIAFAVIAVLIVIGVVYNIYGSQAEAPKTVEGTIPAPREADINMGKTDDGRYYLGNDDAKVTVVEYADYQCPGCAFYSNSLSAAFEKEYIATGKVKLIFQDFPLQMHANAVHAAIAARCAGDQSMGAFWQFHDVLFTNQNQWKDLEVATFKQQNIAYATQLGLDSTAFAACIEVPENERTVRDFQKKSNDLGLPGTPSFAVQGIIVDASSAKSVDDIDALVRTAVNSALEK